MPFCSNFFPILTEMFFFLIGRNGDALVNCYESQSVVASARYYRFKRNGNFTAEVEIPEKKAELAKKEAELTKKETAKEEVVAKEKPAKAE